jgi:hypothetical protein
MGSGVLAHKTKKERLKPLFFMLDTFHARQPAGVIENSKLQAFLLVASVGGVERAEMNRSPSCASGCGGEVTTGFDNVCFIGVDRK